MGREYIIILVCLLLLMPVTNSGIFDFLKDNEYGEIIHSRTATTDTYRTSDGHFKTVQYVGARNMPDENGVYQPFSDLVTMSVQGCNLVLSYGIYELSLQPYFIMDNGERYSCADIPESITVNPWKIDSDGKIKYGVDFYNVSNAIKNNWKFMVLHRSGVENLHSSDFQISDGDIIIKNKIKLGHEDILSSYTIPIINRTDIVIGNLTNNFIDNGDGTWNISFDPSVTYDFGSDYQGIKMWAYDTGNTGCNDEPPAVAHHSCLDTDITSESSLDASDNIDSVENPTYLATFLFKSLISGIDTSVINSINWTVEVSDNAAGGSMEIYIWNDSSSSYLEKHSFDPLGDTFKSVFIDTNIDDFINSADYTHLLVQRGNTGVTVYVDYVKFEIEFDGVIINNLFDDDEILNNLSTQLNTSQTAYNETIWYTWNDGKINTTLCTTSQECEDTITFPRQGYYNLTVYGNKSDGSETSETVNLFVGNTTGYKNPTADGDDYNDWFNPNKFYTLDDDYAQTGTVGDSQDYYNFGFDEIPSDVDNVGVIVNITGAESGGAMTIGTELSFDGGTSYTISDYDGSWTIQAQFKSVIYGGNTDNWGRTWASSELSNSSFRVRINYTYESTGGALFYGDHIQTNVYYFYGNIIPPQPNIITPNNTNYTYSSGINLTYNYTDDNDWVNNVSIYLDGTINQTETIQTDLNTNLNFTLDGISDGEHTYYIEVCDSDNSCNQSVTNSFTVDMTAPSLSIVFPIQDASYTTNTLDLNYTVSDATIGLDTCWYRNNTDATNITIVCGTNTTISQGSDGSYTVYMWANDTLGNLASTFIDYVISTTAPSLTLINPPDSGIFWFDSGADIYFNYTSSDDNGIDTCQLWGNWTGTWHLNLTNIHGGDTSVDVVEGNFTIPLIDEGVFKWNVWCNDTNGDKSWGLSNWTIGVDETYPLIDLVYPTNTTYTSIQTIINYTRSDTNLENCWYSTNNGAVNSTPNSCANFTGLDSGQGSSTWIIWINDSANNQNLSNITFFVDSINPSISMSTSFNTNDYLNYNTSIKINLTISDTNLQTCWYNDNNGGNTTFTCGNNLSLNLSEVKHNINIFANDSLNNQNTDVISFTPDVTYPNANISNVEVTGGSQTFDFDVNFTDTNMESCWYTVRNSSGGVDIATIENDTITCQSLNNGETVSAYGTFNITVYGNDSAGNENSTTETFTLTSIVEQAPGGGGGMEEIIIIGENVTWGMSTDVRGNSYDFFMSKGSKRNKPIIFSNKEDIEITLNITCEDIVGGLCDYVVFSNTSVYLEATQNIEERIEFTLHLPEEMENGIYDFNIRATATIDGSTGKISVRARIGEAGIFGWLVNKFIGKTTLDLGWLRKDLSQFEIFNFFILILPFIILAPMLYFIALKDVKIKFPVTFLTTFLMSFILLFFVGQ